MSRKTTKIVFLIVILIALIGASIGLYFTFNYGAIVGRIEVEFGTPYYLSEIRPTERFAGATMNPNSYFQINHDKQTGNLYLAGLTATSAPIPFIVTKYKKGVKSTTIEFEYVMGDNKDAKIHRLQAITTSQEIRIKTVESHGVQTVITQNPEDVHELDYLVTIMVFRKSKGAAA